MGNTYVVTGGAGFIGSHLTETLLKQNHTIRIIDNFSTGKHANLEYLQSLNGDLSVHQHNITDKEAIQPAFEGADAVFHLAAVPSVPYSIAHPLETHRELVTGTVNVLEAAREGGVQRVVFATSSAIYGDRGNVANNEDMIARPLSPYAVAKLVGENYCQQYSADYGLETVCLRYFNVFGPRQNLESEYAAVIPKFIRMMLKGENPTIYGDGLQTRDFTFVKDVIRANLLAAENADASGKVFNIATGNAINLLDLISRLNELLGTNLEPTFLSAREGEILHSVADVRKARDELDYTPAYNLNLGLQETITWLRN